eukprot:TRINITY_DN2055_c0_g1_i1.p1 TRINITY_DN2055_c0_g1~~TRINITY_DN2055_c0_g1_i1.p1  ORF type:complete len:950 (-),score=155.91 TRINITY_DN2055_c0_g1_i1:257-3049(-)
MGDSKKDMVIKECLKTEQDYLSDLDVIIDVYQLPLVDQGLITSEQCKVLFANVSDLRALNQSQMLAPLQERFDAASSAGLSLSSIKLGDLFVQISAHLKVYTEYCANQPNALAMLKNLKNDNKEFNQFDSDLQNHDPAVRGLDMLSFIIKPVQRLCKYPLLIRELIATTDKEDEEHARLSVAMEKVSEAVSYVNEIQRQEEAKAADKMSRILQIEASIEGVEHLNLSGDTNRFIVKLGEVNRQQYKKKPQPSTLILFNNLLLVLKPKAAKKGKVRRPFQLDFNVSIDQTNLTDLGDTDDNLIVNAFEVKDKQSGVGVTLCATSIEEKRLWLKLIKEKIKEYQIMKATRMRNKSRAVRTNSSMDIKSNSVGSPSRGSFVGQSASSPTTPAKSTTTNTANWGQRPASQSGGSESARASASSLQDSTKSGFTPVRGESNEELLWACALGDHDMLKRYVDLGQDPSTPNYDGRTALHLAVDQGHLAIVKYLVQVCQVPLDVPDRWGNTPQALATPEILEIFRRGTGTVGPKRTLGVHQKAASFAGSPNWNGPRSNSMSTPSNRETVGAEGGTRKRSFTPGSYNRPTRGAGSNFMGSRKSLNGSDDDTDSSSGPMSDRRGSAPRPISKNRAHPALSTRSNTTSSLNANIPSIATTPPDTLLSTSSPSLGRPSPVVTTPKPTGFSSRSGYLLKLQLDAADRATTAWSNPQWHAVKKGSLYVFNSKEDPKPSSRVSLLSRGVIPRSRTDLMMLARVKKSTSAVFPFSISTSDSAEPAFYAAPSEDSRNSWLRAIENSLDGTAAAALSPGGVDHQGVAEGNQSGSYFGTPRPASTSSPTIQPKITTTPRRTSSADRPPFQWLIGQASNGQIKWSSYDAATNKIVEKAFSDGQASIVLTHGVFAKAGPSGYLLNFASMTQTHVANQSTRPIKRMVRPGK